MGDSIRLRSSAFSRLSLCGIAAFGIMALSGCSASKVLDALNPVTWYDDLTGETASAEAAKKNANAAAFAAGADLPYPNLSTVPTEPTNGLSEEEKSKLTEGLLADREHARYTDQQIRSGNASATMPGLETLPQGAPSTGSLMAGGGLAVGGGLAPDVPREAPPPPDMKPLPDPIPVKPSAPQTPQQTAEAPVPVAPAAPVTETTPAQVSQRAQKTSNQVAQISFTPGSNAVPASGSSALAMVIAKQKETTGSTIRIVGHSSPLGNGTDPTGDKLAAYQAALSRANAVKQSLVNLGVAANDIIAEASATTDGGSADRADLNVEY